MKKQLLKNILLAVGIIGLSTGLVVPIVSCSFNLDGNYINLNDGITVVKLGVITTYNKQPVGTSSTSAPSWKLTANNNTLNFPSQIAYNGKETVGCIITLLTENEAFNSVSRIIYNPSTNEFEVYNGFNQVWYQSSDVAMLFNLTLINPPTHTFKNTSYYFKIMV